MSNVYFIIDPRLPNSDAHTAMKSIVAQQRAALMKAGKLMFRIVGSQREQKKHIKDVFKEYRATLVPSITKLHSLRYSIISFYIDHLIFIQFKNKHRYMSVLHTLIADLHHFQSLTKSCLQKHLQERRQQQICGIVHIHNQADSQTLVSMTKIIRVSHMFYIRIQFLEILLVGGVTEHACKAYHSFKIWCHTVYPFARSNNFISLCQKLTFCGSHPPFTTIMPGNSVTMETNSVIINRYSSLKLKFTAVDMLVREINLDDLQSTVA